MRTYITTLMLVATLGLVSCGGGNDVASSGTTAVSAAASATTTTATASAPSTSAITATEPKVNGQIDERTGVAPVAAQMTIAQTVAACNASGTYGGGGQATGPLLSASTNPTLGACIAVMPGIAYGNPWNPGQNGGCLESESMAGYVGFPYGIRSSQYGPPLSSWAQLYCYNIASYCCSNSCFNPLPLGSQQTQSAFCATYNANNQ
jgi:hypothetical protein